VPNQPSHALSTDYLRPFGSARRLPSWPSTRLWILGRMQVALAGTWLVGRVKHHLAPGADRARHARETQRRAVRRFESGVRRLRGPLLELGRAYLGTPGGVRLDVPALAFERVRARLVDELGGSLEEHFAAFDTRATRVGGFAQVHRARLRTGEEVEVEVLYPGIEQAVTADLEHLEACAALLRAALPGDVLDAALDEVRAVVAARTELLEIARAIEAAADALAYEPMLVVPRTIPELTTRAVLTTERFEACDIDGYLARGPGLRDRRLRAEAVTTAVARLLFGARWVHGSGGEREFGFLADGRVLVTGFDGGHALDGDDWKRLQRSLVQGVAEAPRGAASAPRTAPEQVLRDLTDWTWEPLRRTGPRVPHDLDGERGRRATRAVLRGALDHAHPMDLALGRLALGSRGLVRRLGAPLDLGAILWRELDRAGLAAAIPGLRPAGGGGADAR